MGQQKCNIYGTSRGNPGPSSYGFCVKDHNGNLCYVQAGVIGHTTNIHTEAARILKALRCWEIEKHATKILETDSLVMLNIIQ